MVLDACYIVVVAVAAEVDVVIAVEIHAAVADAIGVGCVVLLNVMLRRLLRLLSDLWLC